MSIDKENTFTVVGTVARADRFETTKGKQIITLILDVEGKFPQKVPIKCFGRLGEDVTRIKPGTEVRASGRMGGREVNGRVWGDNVADAVEPVSHTQENQGSLPEAEADDSGSVPF